MANVFTENPVVLDTFTSAIDICSSMGWLTGTHLKLKWIEWQVPTTAGHTAVITNRASGSDIFNETCVTNNQSIIKYFDGAWVENLYIATSGVGSGKILIMFE